MDLQRALGLLERFGSTPDSFQTLRFDRFTAPGIDGYVAIRRTRRLTLAISDPVCAREDVIELVHALRIEARARKQRLVFLSVTPSVQHQLELMGFGWIKTGETGFFDLATYSFDGPEMREVRQSARKAEREGVVVRSVRPEDHEAIEDVIASWLGTRSTEGFSLQLGVDPYSFAERKRVFVAERDGEIVGYLSCTPIYARNGWYFEDLIRARDAPRGTNHLLVREALSTLRDEGYAIATLGSAPLGRIREDEEEGQSRRLVNRALEFAYEHFNAFYNFKGLYEFKSSFAPSSWEKQFMCYYPPRLTAGTLAGIVEVSLPGGIPKAVRGKLRQALLAVPRRASRSARRFASGAVRRVRPKRRVSSRRGSGKD